MSARKICSECSRTTPVGAAYTTDWIKLKPLNAYFCSWFCLHRWTVGCVLGEGTMLERGK